MMKAMRKDIEDNARKLIVTDNEIVNLKLHTDYDDEKVAKKGRKEEQPDHAEVLL